MVELVEANATAWQAYWPTVEERCWLGQMDGAAVSHEVWRRTLESCGLADEAVAGLASDHHRELARAAYRPFDDVADLLVRAAASQLRLAVVTNGPSDLQRDKLAALGLSDAFDVVVISGEIGAAKPDAAVFHLATRQLGVEPGRVWHIGDSPTTDVAGARAAGLIAVWLDRDGRSEVGEGSRADLVIRSLAQLDLSRSCPTR